MDSSVHLFLVDVWLCFLGLFLTFYVLLDGFDLGIGILSLFVREEHRRGIMMASLIGDPAPLPGTKYLFSALVLSYS